MSSVAQRHKGRAGRARLLAVACTLATCTAVAQGLPGFEQVRAAYRASDVRVLDRHGELMQRVRIDAQGRRGDWLALSDVSVAMQQAVILSEDRRFAEHGGVDWQAAAAAAWGRLWRGERRGASTLSMQVAGLLQHPPGQGGSGGRTLWQKLDQAVRAQALERRWSKAQILEAYLNLVPLRGELVGVDALAQLVFSKSASGLDARESAVAAAMLRGPNAPAAVIARRACGVLRAMEKPSECVGLPDFVRARLSRRNPIRHDRTGLAPHFSRWVLRQVPLQAGTELRTSLDGQLQKLVLDSVARRLAALRTGHAQDAAVVVLDRQSGAVLAYVGSSGALSDAPWVDHAQSLRQAGSTLKPFLYEQALEEQRLTAVSLLDDSPLDLATGSGLYIPRNYDERYAGWVSVRTALASSLNIPAVRTLMMVTPDAFHQRLLRLGLPLDKGSDFYGYSLALGSADVTLLSLTNAYRSLANLGRHGSVSWQPSHAGRQQGDTVMQPGASWIVGNILADPQARARTFGLDSPLSTPFWTAVKTGTSKDMRDNWCLGWSQDYVVGVWVGNSAGASMRDVSGVSGAGPVWHDVMQGLHAARRSRPEPVPAGVTAAAVAFEHDLEPARMDYFLGDTRTEYVRTGADLPAAQTDAARIAGVVDGTVLALDPDIPPDLQRVRLSVRDEGAAYDALQWRIDDRVVGQGAPWYWLPLPGNHVIELLDASGKQLDRVSLQVRGAILKPPRQH